MPTAQAHNNQRIKPFSPSNWEYILRAVSEQVQQTNPENKKAFQLEFDKRIEARLNDIATAHQSLALSIARKFKFMTAYERANQYLDYPKTK